MVKKKTGVLHNHKSGGNGVTSSQISSDELLALLETSGLEVFSLDIATEREQLLETIHKENIELLVAAGGDGTVNAAASLAIETDIPLAVVPLGSLNHFAKDAGIPLEPEKAIDVIAQHHVKRIDYCRVNEHVFVNNSSVGLYPVSVLRRGKLEPKLGKWLSALVSTIQAAVKLKSLHLKIEINGERHKHTTPLIFIGNNTYDFERVGLAERENLDGGNLFIYIIRANRVTAILRLLLVGLFGKRLRSHDFKKTSENDIEIHSRKKTIKVAIDGEVKTLKTPLTYSICSNGLKICASKRG